MIEIMDLKENQIPGALNISLTELGSDYLEKKDFLETIGNKTCFCKVALCDGEVAGFSICKIFGPDMVDEMLHLPDSPERDSLMKADRIGLLDSVSVSETAKGRGLGSMLAQACYDRFISENANVVCAMAWESVTGQINIGGILEKRLRMKSSLRIKGYWNEFVTSPNGHDCPVCGAPCKCFGKLYSVDTGISPGRKN